MVLHINYISVKLGEGKYTFQSNFRIKLTYMFSSFFLLFFKSQNQIPQNKKNWPGPSGWEVEWELRNLDLAWGMSLVCPKGKNHYV